MQTNSIDYFIKNLEYNDKRLLRAQKALDKNKVIINKYNSLKEKYPDIGIDWTEKFFLPDTYTATNYKINLKKLKYSYNTYFCKFYVLEDNIKIYLNGWMSNSVFEYPIFLFTKLAHHNEYCAKVNDFSDINVSNKEKFLKDLDISIKKILTTDETIKSLDKNSFNYDKYVTYMNFQ